MSMTGRFGRPFRQYPIPRYPFLNPDWARDDYIRAQQAALSRDYQRLAMDNLGDGRVARRHEQPDYTRKDFKRAADDWQSCLQEALEFFPRFDMEFTNETKEIKKYLDTQLLNTIWEKKVQCFENGPRGAGSTTDNGSRNNQAYRGNNDRGDSSSSAAGIKSLQDRIHVTVNAMLDCEYPEPTDSDEGAHIRGEEVRDFEDRMRKMAGRLYSSLSCIAYDFRAFRRVIRDLTTMSQDLNLFPLKLWKADDEQHSGADGHEYQ